MQTLRRVLASALLITVLAVSSIAGEMGTPLAPPTGDPSTGKSVTETSTSTLDGEMGTPLTEYSDPVTMAALSLLQTATALF